MRHLPVPVVWFVFVMAGAIALSACDAESEYIDEEIALAIIAPGQGNDVAVAQRAQGLAVALRELAAMRGNEPTWTAATTIADAFPLYLPGMRTPSYYEFKVVTGGEDSGYVVVNVDRTDILVVETAVAGKTLTEAYRDATGRNDLQVVRYDWVMSGAVETVGGTEKPMAVIGFEDSSDVVIVDSMTDVEAGEVAAYDAEYVQYVSENGCARPSTRESLDSYYGGSEIAELEITAEEVANGDFIEYLNDTVPVASSLVYHSLDHHFSSPTWHMPHWYQPHDADDYPVGCGSVAWAMVYAYWKQFHGKSSLFNGMDLTDEWHPSDCNLYLGNQINAGMWEIAEWVETVYGGSGDDLWGMTYPWNMEQGISYAMLRGYLFTTCEEDSGTEWSKFQEIDDEIVADRPAILRINAGGVGAGDHYVSIEATRYLEQVGLDSLGYRANYGWSGKASPVWIYVQAAPEGGEYHSAFNAYYIDM